MKPMESPQEQVFDPAMMEVVATAIAVGLFQFLRLTETHEAKNKIFEEALNQLSRTIETFFKLPGITELELSFRGEHIFINKMRLRPRARQFYIYRFLLKFMRMRRIGIFKLIKMPRSQDLLLVLWQMAKTLMSDDKTEPVIRLQEFLKENRIEGFDLRVTPKLTVGKGEGGEGGIDDVEIAAVVIYDRIRKFADLCFENMENAQKFSPEGLDRLMGDLGLLSEEDIVQMLRLISIKRYDRPNAYRAVNTCFLVSAWAFSLRLPRGVVSEIAGAALLHPLSLDSSGKPQGVISAKARGDVMSKVERLKSVWPVTDLQLLALLEWGIPYGEDGVYEIGSTKCYSHFMGRMIRVAADFEMMTTVLPGQRVYLPDEALAAMIQSQGIYDPTFLKLFVNWMGVYPVGSLVQLQTGEVAQIFAGASDPTKFTRPLVTILKDSKGNLLERPEIFDLSTMNEKLGTYRKSIKRSLSIDEAGIPADRFKMTPVGV